MIQCPSATALCEDFLRRERSYNVENSIWPSVNRLIDQMLERGAELTPVYEELNVKLKPIAVEQFLSAILGAGAIWHPGSLSAASQAHHRLVELRSEIPTLAAKLAARLRERTELSESSGFHTSATYHVVDLIELASKPNALFRMYLLEHLSELSHQYDLKYWPSVADVVDAIAKDARNVDINPSNPITEAGTRSPKRSKADTFRVLQSALKEYRQSFGSPITAAFRLSDESWATLLNVVLDLDPDNLVDGPYTKRIRQRGRNALASTK